MKLRLATLALMLALGGCFGQPEDEFTIDGTVAGGDNGALKGQTVLLQRDEGFTADGCTAFSDFATLTSDDTGAFHHEIIRQEARGALADLRCFRAIVIGRFGERTTVTWPFANHDVSLPPLWLWPDNHPVQASSFNVLFPEFPSNWTLAGAGVEPVAYRVEMSAPDGTRAWRVPAFQVSSVSFPERNGQFQYWEEVGALDSNFRAAAIQRVERYDRDPFGQLVASLFERRIESPPVQASLFDPFVHLSDGAGCPLPQGADGGCLLTDGDPTATRLPTGTRALTIDFPTAYRPRNLLVQGIGADGPWTRLTVDSSPDDTTGFTPDIGSVTVDWNTLTDAEVCSDDPAPTLDIGPILLTPPEVDSKRLQIRAVNAEGQTIDLKWVGEITVF